MNDTTSPAYLWARRQEQADAQMFNYVALLIAIGLTATQKGETP